MKAALKGSGPGEKPAKFHWSNSSMKSAAGVSFSYAFFNLLDLPAMEFCPRESAAALAILHPF